MKVVAQVLIVTLFLIAYAAALLVGTARFKILNYNLWKSSFEKEGTYQTLAEVVKNSLNQQVDEEGGNKNDISVLTDLVTVENTKDFVDNNLRNTIDYLNGKSGQLIVYVPISKAPKGLLPQNIASLNNEMTLTQLGQKFDVVGLDALPIKNLSNSGQILLYVFLGLMVFLLILTISLIWLVENGSKFISLSIALILSGLLTLGLAQAGAQLTTYINQNMINGEMTQMIIAAITPPIILNIVSLWVYVGVFVSALGALLLFFKKPGFK